MEKMLNIKSRAVVMRIIPIMLILVMIVGAVPVSAKTKQTREIPSIEVFSKDELIEQLETDGEETINFSTYEAGTITIPSGKYSSKKHLVIRTDYASIINKAKFATINIEAVTDYTEKVSGNKITVSGDGAIINVYKKKKVAKLTINAANVRLSVDKSAKIKKLAIAPTEELDVALGTMMADEITVISTAEYEDFMWFSEVMDLFDNIRASYYKETDPVELMEGAARGVLWSLEDPYSYYYNPQEYSDMWAEDQGNYVGIGVMINSPFLMKVTSTSVPGSPLIILTAFVIFSAVT